MYNPIERVRCLLTRHRKRWNDFQQQLRKIVREMFQVTLGQTVLSWNDCTLCWCTGRSKPSCQSWMRHASCVFWRKGTKWLLRRRSLTQVQLLRCRWQSRAEKCKADPLLPMRTLRRSFTSTKRKVEMLTSLSTTSSNKRVSRLSVVSVT